MLNGRQWLQVDTSYPSQTSRTLYLWNSNHALALTVLADSADALHKDSDKYVLPMAASVVLP
jgi:hypothetical protein